MKILLVVIVATVSLCAPARAGDEKPSAEKVYAAKCASCHGKDGKGNEKMAKMFKVEAKELDLVDMEDGEQAEFVKAVQDGKGKKMPAFKGKLGELKAEELHAYVKSLKPAKKEPAKKSK